MKLFKKNINCKIKVQETTNLINSYIFPINAKNFKEVLNNEIN